MASDDLGYPEPTSGDPLSALVEQAQEARRRQDALTALLSASRAVASNLDLPTVLQSIVEAAKEVGLARYAALGVIGDNGLSQFVYSGIDAETAARIGHLPKGLGVLGLLLDEPRAVRVADLSQHPRSVGFPPNHPPMRSFLGVPVRVRGRVFGNLYLTDKLRGGGFTPADVEAIEALAATAGVAVANARLFDQAQRQQRSQRAIAALSRAALSGQPGDVLLRTVVDQARTMSGAVMACVAVPDPARPVLRLTAVSGEGREQLEGTEVPMAGTVADLALRDGGPVVVNDMLADPRLTTGWPREFSAVSGLAVPLADGATGTLPAPVLMLGRDLHGGPFAPTEVQVISAFAEQVAVVLELERTRRLREDNLVLRDRVRIARDLHDHVVQRLYAVGLVLQSLAQDVPAAAEVAEAQVDSLDGVIRRIRSTITGLREVPGGPEGTGARARLWQVINWSRETLGLSPSVEFSGPLDAALDTDVLDDLLAVLTEALANVAKHAGTTVAAVYCTVVPGSHLELTVVDEGRGIGHPTRRSGLGNMAERAARYGGTVDVRPADGAGTVVVWRIPLP